MVGGNDCIDRNISTYPPVVLTTTPKSGTTFLRPILYRLLSNYGYCLKEELPLGRPNTSSFLQRLSNGEFTCSHYDRELFKPVKGEYKIILMIRDLRDIYISYYHFFRYRVGKNTTEQMHIFREGMDELGWSDEAALQNLITGYEIPHGDKLYCFDLLGSTSVFIEQWMDYAENSFCHIVRYEDLLKDGVKTIKGIMDYIGLSPAEEEITKAINHSDMFLIEGRKRGVSRKGSHNRKGVAGEWRDIFDARLKKICKERIGDQLIRLGYEKDHNW